jgi:hypothetical protein
MKVKDNFLDKDKFLELKNLFLNPYFPWYYNSWKVGIHLPKKNDYNFQFTHVFVQEKKINSDLAKHLEPIYEKLKAKEIIRSKINLTTRSPKIIKYEYHKDQDEPCKIACLYFTTNNGYTFFKKGKKVLSKDNRIVIFNNNDLHSGTSHTDTDLVRLVLNINYL